MYLDSTSHDKIKQIPSRIVFNRGSQLFLHHLLTRALPPRPVSPAPSQRPTGRAPCAQMLRCTQLFVTLWAGAGQVPLSMRFSWREYWSQGAISSIRGSSRPRDRTHISYVSCISRQVLYTARASWEAHVYLCWALPSVPSTSFSTDKTVLIACKSPSPSFDLQSWLFLFFLINFRKFYFCLILK